ncbi:MAG: type I restriction endonuclease, partial [Bacteroidaceae bacterium]|nr:type I restriction endonuclease [Bacteroidaceae bacterium]
MSSETYKEDSFELGLIALFKELGYTYESGYDIERDYHSAYYEPVLRDSIRRLNPKVSQTILNDAIKKITNITEGTLIQNNEAFMEMFQGGVEVPFLEKGEMGTARVKLIDYNLIGQNDFRIVNQWTIEEYQKIRCDM